MPLGRHENFCAGYGNPGTEGDEYLLVSMLGVGKTKMDIDEVDDGNKKLEETIAFDAAEAEVGNTYIGQINMSTISSFNGPRMIWGYDVARVEELYQAPSWGVDGVKQGNKGVAVYSLDPLLRAARTLYGTVDERRFNLWPGEHVPCASRSEMRKGSSFLYCSFGIAIPNDREHDACLLMEDVGVVTADDEEVRSRLLNKLARASVRVANQQRVELKEMFTQVRMIEVAEDEIGCALVAAPYFTLARRAALPGEELYEINLREWEELMSFPAVMKVD